MKHKSVALDCPVEFINVEPLNPLISKCQIKVCYVGETPNRNKSVITKDVAREMANSLPGSPIVGYYNESEQDFEEHNRIINISGGEFKIKDGTRPYGFVDLSAKCWFQKFEDDDSVEHEYLMTEGYLWTGQYPECKRVIELGNNQSMELDEDTLNATWAKSENNKEQFFIINEAIISKLCILGDEYEPCFEGSRIASVQFSFEDGFKEQLFSMMNELKDYLDKGGTEVFNRYAVEIGDALWCNLHEYLLKTYPGTDKWSSVYSVEGIYEENTQKFAILKNCENNRYYRLNFVLSETSGFEPQEGLIEVTKTFVPSEEPQFALEDVEKFENEFKKKNKDEEEKEDKKEQEETDKNDNTEKDEDNSDSEEEDDDEDEDKKKKKKYSLDEVVEYQDLMVQFSELEAKYNALVEEKENLDKEMSSLVEFKCQIEKKEKEEMIQSFYMLSDEDKKNVIENIDKYSVSDIEKELSVICVRNKVNFSLDEEEEKKEEDPTTFNLEQEVHEDVPAWVKAVMDTEKNKNM